MTNLVLMALIFSTVTLLQTSAIPLDYGCSKAQNLIECYLSGLCQNDRLNVLLNCGGEIGGTGVALASPIRAPTPLMGSSNMGAQYLREAHTGRFCDGEGRRFRSACDVLDHVCFAMDPTDITYCDRTDQRYRRSGSSSGSRTFGTLRSRFFGGMFRPRISPNGFGSDSSDSDSRSGELIYMPIEPAPAPPAAEPGIEGETSATTATTAAAIANNAEAAGTTDDASGEITITVDTPPTTPTTPTMPTTPTTPTTPTNPTTPKIPTTPTTTTTPTTPVTTPVTSTTPTTPVTKKTSTSPTIMATTPTTLYTNPSALTNPINPSAPTAPPTPFPPNTPIIPSPPYTPTTPLAPTTPTNPSGPTTPINVVTPTAPLTPPLAT